MDAPMSSSRPKRKRACDSCRRIKSRCNGSDGPGGRCATCITHGMECTYNLPPLPRNPRHQNQPPSQKIKPKTYIQALESRISNLERLIRHYELNDTSETLPPTHCRLSASDSESEDYAEPHPKLGSLFPQTYHRSLEGDPHSHSEDHSEDELSCTEPDLDESFARGQEKAKSSMLASSMLMFTHQLFSEEGHKDDPPQFMRTRRMEFWGLPSWLPPMLEPPTVQLEFPEMSLMVHLVNSYFDNLDVILPLLHRPSFMRSIEEGLHELDQNFGATVLLVCAIGCMYTDHPSVVHELSTSTPCTAWVLYNQVNRIRKAPYLPHSLHEVQIYPLSAVFLDAYSPTETPWLIIGTGLRILQDNGVHRKFFSKKTSLEKELWKRAFWVLVVLDRSFSSVLGRACVLQDEDFDADLPFACDDEDLDVSDPIHPTEASSPTRMSCFVAAIKLNQILAFALRTIYSTRKSRVILGYVGKSWEKQIIATLDSALNTWIDAVPDRLRRDSKEPARNRAELIQTTFLWTQFYEIQLHIHRMFALKEPPDPELSASSMIICRNASKECVAIMESARDVSLAPLHCFLPLKSLFMSTIFLLLMFSKKKKGIDHSSPEFRAIEIGMAIVEQTGKRRRASLHLRDIAKVLHAAVDNSYYGWKFTPSDWARMKFAGVRYVDQDGTLSNEGRMGRTGPGTNHANVGGELPPVIRTTIWEDEQETVATEVPIDIDHDPTHAVDLFSADFFADLFSDPSFTGFTGIYNQFLAGGPSAHLIPNS